jgi:hypothetical protein
MWASLVAAALRLYARTWRVTRGPLPLEGPFVAAVWHGELLPLVALHADRAWAAVASRSSDGDRIAAVLGQLGYEVIRGSSSRGALSAVRMARRRLDAGRIVVLTVDGPRGPAGVAQPGAAALAAQVALPVVWARVEARGWRARSWDRFLVPWPGARVHLRYGVWRGEGALGDAMGAPFGAPDQNAGDGGSASSGASGTVPGMGGSDPAGITTTSTTSRR